MKLTPIRTEKPCIQCKNQLPLTDFYIYKKTGIYSSRCKKCAKEYHRQSFNVSYKKRAEVLRISAKSNSKKQNREFSITTDDIILQYETQNGKCYYSGRNLTYTNGDRNIMSIDRKDSSKGYTKDNIVLCCWCVNKMKGSISTIDFIQLCQDIFQYSNKI